MFAPIALYLLAGLGLAFVGIFVPVPLGTVLNNIGLHFFDPYTALGLTGAYFFFSNLARIIVFHDTFDWEIYKNLLPGSLVGGIGVAWLTAFINAKLLTGILLAMALVYILRGIFSKEEKNAKKETRLSGFIVGLVTGAISQFGGPGGSLRMAYISNRVQSMQAIHANTAAVSFTVAIFTTLTRVGTHQVEWRLLVPLLLVFPVQILISLFGKKILERLAWKPKTFRLIVNTAVILSILLVFPTLFA